MIGGGLAYEGARALGRSRMRRSWCGCGVSTRLPHSSSLQPLSRRPAPELAVLPSTRPAGYPYRRSGKRHSARAG